MSCQGSSASLGLRTRRDVTQCCSALCIKPLGESVETGAESDVLDLLVVRLVVVGVKSKAVVEIPVMMQLLVVVKELSVVVKVHGGKYRSGAECAGEGSVVSS